MTVTRSRTLLLIATTTVALSSVFGPALGNPVTQASAQPSADDRARIRKPDEFGVIGRKVKDVVAEQRSGRRLGALDPKTIRLANDDDAYIDETGKLFYADVSLSPPATAETSPAEAPSVAEGTAPATGSAFLLNSRPGSPHTIYLDFDGETVSNSAWNAGRANPKTVPAYDSDGNAASFSAAEEQTIRNVWQAVAEDWAAFDVNVTTQRPASNDAFIRNTPSDNVFGAIAIVTPDRWTCTSCGGVAYVDIFDPFAPSSMYYQYAWVFPSSSWSSSSIANVISHEVGHNFGLSHDGITGSEYYGGTGSWGPIMGNPGRTYVQWSRGEYSGSTNTEDDLAIISGYAGALGDSSSSLANAVPIGSAGLTQVSGDDVITAATDADFHAVDITGGYLKATFNRSLFANLYPRVALLNSAGTEVAATALFSGTSTVLYSNSIPNGRYYLKTEPTQDTFSPGFTTYGSLGYFGWTVTRADTPVMATVALSPLGDRTFSATWSATSQSTESLSYLVSLCTGASCGAAMTTTSTSAVLVAAQPTGSYYVKVTASNRFGLNSAELSSSSVNVLSRPIAPQVQKLRFDDAADLLNVEWGNGLAYSPVVVNDHTITVKNRTTNATLSATVSGLSGATSFAIPVSWDGAWVDVSIVSNTGSPSPWNASDPSTASMLLGRAAVGNQAPGVGGGSRTAAPPAPATPNTRTGAPGA